MSSSEVKTIKAISEARASFLIDNLDVSENIIYNIRTPIGKCRLFYLFQIYIIDHSHPIPKHKNIHQNVQIPDVDLSYLIPARK